MTRLVVLLLAVGYCLGAPVEHQQFSDAQQSAVVQEDIDPQVKGELIQDYDNEVVRMYTLRTLAEGIKLEQAAEDRILEAAVETLQEEPSPERNQRLQEVGDLIRRDKRAVQALSSLLGSSSGGGGANVGASAGSDSGSILSLVGPLLGSSSGGGGSGGSSGDGASPAAGSDSGAILNLVGPLLSSSSSGGGGGAGSADGGVMASAGSDLGSILGLITPLLGSSSGGGGGGAAAGGDGASVSASAGSDSGSILNLILPLLTSSSSSGGGGLLGVSGSSSGGGGGGGGVAVDAGTGGQPAGIIGQIKGAKIALVGDKIQLLLRVKFGLLNKILTLLTTKIAFASLPPGGADLQNLKYPN